MNDAERNDEEDCAEARRVYLETLDPLVLQPAWEEAVQMSMNQLASLMSDSHGLTDIQAALMTSGKHTRALRHLMSPPFSQDQFKLLCPDWPKSSEKNSKPLDPDRAMLVAQSIREWLDPELAKRVTERDQARLFGAAFLMAGQEYNTQKRLRLSHKQEGDVVDCLVGLGFRQVSASVIDQPGAMEPKTFLVKTQFKTADDSSHEVDVAVGLPSKYILAMECKVSNDATNSIKRVNDVMKKAEAWSRQWGNFVITAAMLQGVFKPTEIHRLRDSNIQVFWSHRFAGLGDWLREKM